MRAVPFLAPFLLSIAAFAQTTPSPATATRPADVDLSTPQKALAWVITRTQAGDVAGVQRALYMKDAAERQAFETALVPAITQMALYQAAIKKFGGQAREEFSELNDANEEAREQLQNIDTLQLQMDGDTATLSRSLPGDEKPDPADSTAVISLQRVDGDWKVAVTSLAKASDSSPEQAAATLKLYSSLQADLNAGKFATAKEMHEKMQAGEQQIMQQALDPDSAPLAPPATQPKSSTTQTGPGAAAEVPE